MPPVGGSMEWRYRNRNEAEVSMVSFGIYSALQPRRSPTCAVLRIKKNSSVYMYFQYTVLCFYTPQSYIGWCAAIYILTEHDHIKMSACRCVTKTAIATDWFLIRDFKAFRHQTYSSIQTVHCYMHAPFCTIRTIMMMNAMFMVEILHARLVERTNTWSISSHLHALTSLKLKDNCSYTLY